eukprot:2092987-Pyramimonas_sp.AAC.1
MRIPRIRVGTRLLVAGPVPFWPMFAVVDVSDRGKRGGGESNERAPAKRGGSGGYPGGRD